MKLSLTGISFGGRYDDDYWLYWWNFLPPDVRYVGYDQSWFDGPISSFGFWWFNVSWRMPFTKHVGRRSWVYYCKAYRDYIRVRRGR